MTLHDFNRAKEIEEELEILKMNVENLDRILTDSYLHPAATYTFEMDDWIDARLDCDAKFIESAIEYYENEIKKLEAEFEALGKEN